MSSPTHPASTPLSSRPSPSHAVLQAAQGRLSPALATTVESLSDDALHDRAENSHRARWEKLVEREIVGPNSYIEVEKAFNTLLRLSSTILSNPSDPKPRTLKASSKLLRSTLLELPADGGLNALIALGFKRKVVQFEEMWVFEDSVAGKDKGRLTGLEALRIAKEVLDKKEKEIRDRSKKAQIVALSKKEEDETRRQEALAAIEHDRLQVKARAEREAAHHRHLESLRSQGQTVPSPATSPRASRSDRGSPVIHTLDGK